MPHYEKTSKEQVEINRKQALSLFVKGLKPDEVAKLTDIPLGTLKAWYYNDKKFREEYRDALNRQFEQNAPKAFGILMQCIERDDNPWLQFQAAQFMINRAGIMVKNESENQIVIKLAGAPEIGMPNNDGNDIQAEEEKKLALDGGNGLAEDSVGDTSEITDYNEFPDIPGNYPVLNKRKRQKNPPKVPRLTAEMVVK